MKTALITIVSGRHAHLRRQQEWLGRAATPIDLYVVVTMNDPAAQSVVEGRVPAPLVIELQNRDSELPLARARNAGAKAAIDRGAELLVFLDVDCLPSAELITAYRDAATAHPSAILGGAVGYLPHDADYSTPATLGTAAAFHAFRPRLEEGEIAAADPKLFWSLSFAVGPATWKRIGGFCEDFVGYGAEDTDFAMVASDAGVDFLWVGGAEALHQHHTTNDPPTQHLDAILTNGALFAKRWGFWPMEGWLLDFERLGLIRRGAVTGDWIRTRNPTHPIHARGDI